MGRHSAPDDGDDRVEERGDDGAALRTEERSRGRHSQSGDDAVADREDDSDSGPIGLDLIDEALHHEAPTVADDAAVADSPDVDRPDIDEDDHTAQIPPITDQVLDRPVPEAVTDRFPPITGAPSEAAEPENAAADAAAAGAEGKGVSDFALVRRHVGVQLWCLAAIVVPVGVHLAVLAALDRFEARQILIWIWIPLIVAGVLVGVVLDVGHRRYRRAAHDEPAANDEPAGHDEPAAHEPVESRDEPPVSE